MNIITNEHGVNRATVTFHTTPEIKERLNRLATVTRRSKSFLTNAAVERYLAAEEEFVASVQAGIAGADAGQSYTTSELKERLNKFISDQAKVSRST